MTQERIDWTKDALGRVCACCYLEDGTKLFARKTRNDGIAYRLLCPDCLPHMKERYGDTEVTAE